MSYINYHTKKYTEDLTTENQFTNVSNTILAFVQSNILQGFNTISNTDRVYSADTVMQDFTYSSPIAINKKYPLMSEFNEYTWSIDNKELYVLGNRFLGDYSSIKLPYVDTTQNNILADMLNSSMLSVLKQENFSDGYAYLRMAQALVSLGVDSKQTVVNVGSAKRTIKLRS